MNFTLLWKNPATLRRTVAQNGQPVAGAIVTATLYQGRSLTNPDTLPGTPVVSMQNMTFTESGGGLYTFNVAATAIPGIASNYVLVTEATLASVLIGHWEDPTSVVAELEEENAADPRDLVTVADAMAWIPITNVAEEDVFQDLVTAASLYFLNRTGRATLNSILPFNETYDGSGSQRQYVKNAPILKVLSLTINGRLQAASTAFGVPGYVIDEDRKSISLRGGGSGSGTFTTTSFGGWPSGPCFAKGLQNVSVNYLAGYSLVEAEPWQIPATTPYEVTVANSEDFVLDLGVRYLQTGVALAPVASSPTQGQYSVNAEGEYSFSAADASQNIVIAYGYNGTPQDLQVAAKRVIALIYKRKPQEDLRSKMLTEGGTTLFRDWECPPEIERVIQKYTRRAVV